MTPTRNHANDEPHETGGCTVRHGASAGGNRVGVHQRGRQHDSGGEHARHRVLARRQQERGVHNHPVRGVELLGVGGRAERGVDAHRRQSKAVGRGHETVPNHDPRRVFERVHNFERENTGARVDEESQRDRVRRLGQRGAEFAAALLPLRGDSQVVRQRHARGDGCGVQTHRLSHVERTPDDPELSRLPPCEVHILHDFVAHPPRAHRCREERAVHRCER